MPHGPPSPARPPSRCVAELCRRYAPETVGGDRWRRRRRRSRRPPGSCGNRGGSPSTPGAASSSRRTRPRSPAPSPSSTRSPAASMRRRQRALRRRSPRDRSTATSSCRRTSAPAPSAFRAGRSGLSRWEFVTSDEVYAATWRAGPTRCAALVGFGANLLLSHADCRPRRDALTALDFYVHADLFMNPTAELADVVLPVASAFEREALKIGFEVSPEAQAHRPASPAGGSSRAARPGRTPRSCSTWPSAWPRRSLLGGDIDAACATSSRRAGSARGPPRRAARRAGAARDALPEVRRAGRMALPPASPRRSARSSSTRRHCLEHGYPPLPEYAEPAVGPALATRPGGAFPAGPHLRQVHAFLRDASTAGCPASAPRARTRRSSSTRTPPPPAASAPGDWVSDETPAGSVRARARLNDSPRAAVVCGQHGWWQACEEIGAPGYDPFGSESANLNLLIDRRAEDPVSGSPPLRSSMCQVALA